MIVWTIGIPTGVSRAPPTIPPPRPDLRVTAARRARCTRAVGRLGNTGARVDNRPQQLHIGQATYKIQVSTQDPTWQDPREMTRHLAFNRNHPLVRGDIYFSAKDARELRWRGDGSSYAAYRFEGDGRPGPCAFSDAEHPVATVHGSGGHSAWVDESAPEGQVTYVVSALDRAHREGPPSTPARVRR